MGPANWGLGAIDGVIVPPGKASNLLNDHLITGLLLMSGSAQEVKRIHTYKPYWLCWVVIFMKHILSVMSS